MPRVVTAQTIAQFRSRLCDVAAELLAEQGIAGFNMRELAKRLRVSPMTAYRYFKDKDEILGHLRARGFARLADALDDARTRAPAAVVRAYVRFALEEPITYRLMFDLFPPAGPEPPDLPRQQRRVRAAMNYLALMMSDADEPESKGDVLWSALHGVVALHLAAKLDAAAFQRTLAAAMQQFAGASPGLLEPGWEPVVLSAAG